MAEETEADRTSEAVPPQAGPKRSPGRPPWKQPGDKMVSRQIYMTEAEWQVCREQGNASAFLRRLVREFAEQQRGDGGEK